MKSDLLWWVIPGVLAGMPMPFIHLDRAVEPVAVETSGQIQFLSEYQQRICR